MNDDQRFLAFGAYFLGAVYLAGVIAAGLVYGDRDAVTLALIAAGLGYVTQVAAAMDAKFWFVAVPWLGSVLAALAAGLFIAG